jgi:hypothetical protein
MGTSFAEFRGSGFWTRDAALEAVLALLVVELQPLADDHPGLGEVLDAWTLQAVAGFTGCVSPDFDRHLVDPCFLPTAVAGLRRVLAQLPAEGSAGVDDEGFARRAERICGGAVWTTPRALAGWVRQVTAALIDLLDGRLPSTGGELLFVDGEGRHFSNPHR